MQAQRNDAKAVVRSEPGTPFIREEIVGSEPSPIRVAVSEIPCTCDSTEVRHEKDRKIGPRDPLESLHPIVGRPSGDAPLCQHDPGRKLECKTGHESNLYRRIAVNTASLKHESHMRLRAPQPYEMIRKVKGRKQHDWNSRNAADRLPKRRRTRQHCADGLCPNILAGTQR